MNGVCGTSNNLPENRKLNQHICFRSVRKAKLFELVPDNSDVDVLENIEKEEGKREIERDDAGANVPVSVHAAQGAQRLAPTQEDCLCYSW